MSLMQYPIHSPYKFIKVQGVHDAHPKGALWTQAGRGNPCTTKNQLLEVKRNVINCKDILKLPSYLFLGTHPVKYLLGMGPMVDMLIQSIDPGRFRTFAKLDTFRSSWSVLSTVYKAYIKGVLERD